MAQHSTRVKAVFPDYDTVSNGDLDTSLLSASVDELCLYEFDESRVADRVADAEILLLNKVKVTRGLLRSAPRLQLIGVAGTGTDNIDLVAARSHGVAVCNVSSYCTASVVQQVWALILALTQHLREHTRLATDGTWVRSENHAALSHPIRELKGRIFGVIGWGELGRGAAQVAEAFGMQVVIANRRGASLEPGRLEFEQLLRTADIVSLHCPLTDTTRGLIGAPELALMKPDALLINTARGGLVDSQALAEALKSGRLAGAGIDVLPQEPPVDGDPLIEPGIANLLVTPHIAWAAREARQRCLDDLAASIRDFRSGGRRGRVD